MKKDGAVLKSDGSLLKVHNATQHLYIVWKAFVFKIKRKIVHVLLSVSSSL